MGTLEGEFEVTSWDETAYRETDGAGKLTRASVAQRFGGGFDGTGSVEWLMCYAADGTARFVGLQQLDGSVDGRRGTFVVETIGGFDGAEAVGSWDVVPGSGTGELVGISGEGSFRAPHGSKASFTLEYALG